VSASHLLYNSVSVDVVFVVKTDQKAIIAFSDVNPCEQLITVSRRTHGPVTQSQHAQFGYCAASNCSFTGGTSTDQSEFDNFYKGALDLLNRCGSGENIAVTTSSRYPEYITLQEFRPDFSGRIGS